NVYVYFRYSGNQKIMCIVNAENKPKDLKMDRFVDEIKNSTTGLDILNGENKDLRTVLHLEPQSFLILELKHVK
ncbi:MAG: cyclomaltodextrinase C-terminal domain-containing protein, partial [Chitinophagaceae bacterium]